MNVAPVVWLKGTVRRVEDRTVEAVEARPAQYDETGRMVARSREAREGYSTRDATVLTDFGGFASVVLSDEAIAAHHGGTVPSVGDEVEWPVRGFVKWLGSEGRKYTVVHYSVAADVAPGADLAVTSGGSRRAEPATV